MAVLNLRNLPEATHRRLRVRAAQRGRSMEMDVVPFLAEDAALAASLRPKTDPLGLSLRHRACLALALAREVPVLTADRQWASLDLGVDIRLIR